jgi:type IV secretory pathway VirB10-like protein
LGIFFVSYSRIDSLIKTNCTMKVVKTNRAHEYGSYRGMSVEGMKEPYIHFDENGCSELEDSVADLVVAEGVGIDYADEADKAPVEESNDAPEASAPENEESSAEDSSDAPEVTDEPDQTEAEAIAAKEEVEADEKGSEEPSDEDKAKAEAAAAEAKVQKEKSDRADLAKLDVDGLREILIGGKVEGNKFARTKDPEKLINLIIKSDIL